MALGTTNISTGLVAQTIQENSSDVGTLCKSTKINKWSRWKPYSVTNKLDGLTDNFIKSINFGMTPVGITIGQIPTSKAAENSLFIWGQWQPPTGGINSPFRLGDFRNYNHEAVDFFVSLELRNNSGGDKPISGNPSFPQFQPFYICRLTWNNDAPIKLNEYSLAGINFNNLHLTLVVGGNVGGFSASELMFAQSILTIGEAISNYSNELLVEMNTSGLADTIIVNENIVLALLAPKATSPEQLASLLGVSLKLNSNITTTKYFDSYAIFGDGGDGGDIPVSTAEGNWAWMGSESPRIESDVNGYVMKFPMLNVTMTTQRSGSGVLRCFIQELGIDFVVTNQNPIDFNAGGTQTLDTTLVIIDIGTAIDQNTGLPYNSLSCKFYVNSITQSVASIFNEQNISIALQ